MKPKAFSTSKTFLSNKFAIEYVYLSAIIWLMTIRAKETLLGIPFRRTVLPNGSVEPINVVEADMATDQITDHVLKDVLVFTPNLIWSREIDYSTRQILRAEPFVGKEIKKANLGRRRFLIYRRTVEWTA
jgi:hypothetical protein